MNKLTLTILSLTLFTIQFSKTTFVQAQNINQNFRTVHNESPLIKDNLEISLKLVRIFGQNATKDENSYFYYPKDVDIDQDGNIYILDSGNNRIQKFDEQGQYLKTIGRKGLGPVEFQAPESFEIDSLGNIYVSNHNNRIMIAIDSNGKEFHRYRIKEFMQFESFSLLNRTNRLIFPKYIWNTGEEYIHNWMPGWYRLPYLEFFDYEKELIVKNTLELNFKDFSYFRKDDFLTFVGNEFYYTIDKMDNVYISYKFRNRIDKYSNDNNLLMTIDRQKPFDETSSSIKFEYVPRRYAVMMNIFSLSIGIDSKGRIWNLSLTRQLTREELKNGLPSVKIPDIINFEIFSPDGELLGTIPWKYFVNMLKMKIIDDNLYIIDTMDEMVVYQYKIIEN